MRSSAMSPRPAAVLFAVAGCAADPAPAPEDPLDPCELEPTVAEGTVELGLGRTFVPVVDGERVRVYLSPLHIWTLVANARVRDLAVGHGEADAAIDLAAFDSAGTRVSLDVGCRAREFMSSPDGTHSLREAYAISFRSIEELEGKLITIRVTVVDRAGRIAVDERDVLPTAEPLR